MKATGIVRKLDSLGRVVLPMELRKTLGINPEDPMEIFVDGDQIIVKKYVAGCFFCGTVSDKNKGLNGKEICKNCLNSFK
jgi:transcriptional pleiotropic regulator of transition state genes